MKNIINVAKEEYGIVVKRLKKVIVRFPPYFLKSGLQLFPRELLEKRCFLFRKLPNNPGQKGSCQKGKNGEE